MVILLNKFGGIKGFLYCRFDLIFLMLDPQDELYDRRLATHLVSLYHQTQEEEEEEYLVSLQNIPQGGRTCIEKSRDALHFI